MPLLKENEEELLYQVFSGPRMKNNWSTKLFLKGKLRRIALPILFWRKDEEELLYQASSKRKMKNCSTRLPLEEKWRRTALPGLLQRKNEEELLYQAFSGPRMKKNFIIRPLPKEKWKRNALPGLLCTKKLRRIALPGLSKREEEESVSKKVPWSPRAKKTKSHTINMLYGRRFCFRFEFQQEL